MTIDSKQTKAHIINLFNAVAAQNEELKREIAAAVATIVAQKTQLIEADQEIARLREASTKSIKVQQTKAAHEQLADAIGGESAWKIAEAFKPHMEAGKVTFSIKSTCYSISTEDELMKKFLARLAVVLGGRAYPFQLNGKKLTLNWKK